MLAALVHCAPLLVAHASGSTSSWRLLLESAISQWHGPGDWGLATVLSVRGGGGYLLMGIGKSQKSLMKQHSNNPRKNSLIHEVGYNLFGDFITLVQTILKITLLSH